jgi:hypothetical protein
MTRAAAVAVVGMLALASVSDAGDVYRWTDDQGTLHISDIPPPAGYHVQTQSLPKHQPRPTPAAAAAAAAAPTAAGTPGATPGGTPAAAGPADVVITSQDNESLGGAVHAFSGTVENKGGTAARDVAIALHVVSPAQGDECLDEEITVAASLKPGDKADFSADFEHPCFRGPTQVDMRPQWQ